MNDLVKENWNTNNIDDFYNILTDYKRDNKILWTKNIINTNYDVLAILSSDLKRITNLILKGNFYSFLDLMPHKYHEDLIINAYLISKIKDFKMQTKYIDKMQKYIDNWAVVDAIKYSVKGNEDKYIAYAQKLIKSSTPFVRRIGIRIFFSFVKKSEYKNVIFQLLDSLHNENEYYVNMAGAWLLCEMFIHYPEDTFSYLKNSKTNAFIINKGISKCRDSYRISDSYKNELLKYKKQVSK